MKIQQDKYKRRENDPIPKNRTWTDRVIDKPPIWASVDLRDGNQALPNPMNIEAKKRMFNALQSMGFKEIEISFPAASATEFNFTRMLIEDGLINNDVTIGVLTTAKEPIVRRALESIKEARKAIIHLYAATSDIFMQKILSGGRNQTKTMVENAVRQIKHHADNHPETEIILEFSPENLTSSDISFSAEVCSLVAKTWGASSDKKIIINLPSTVETMTPNKFADMVEWFSGTLPERDGIILSVHPHNDRGTAVAAAELAIMAGADRVEGCLFGNGERTGNVDIVTLALNMFSTGVDPKLDFGDLPGICRTYTECTGMAINQRQPYAGEFAFTAFSGTHQDAIAKCLPKQQTEWQVPYLPIDPADIGRQYEPIVRINSQSGRGGLKFFVEKLVGEPVDDNMVNHVMGTIKSTSESKGELSETEILTALFIHEKR